MNFQRIEKEPSVYVQKKCCTVSYYKKKCQKELEIQMIERRERGHGGYCNFACCRLKIQILLSLHALNID